MNQTRIRVETTALETCIKDPEKAYNLLRGKNTYLLESCEGKEKVARYSFIGFDPAAKIIVQDKKTRFIPFTQELETAFKDTAEHDASDPLNDIRQVIRRFTPPENNGEMFSSRFTGGFVGYIAYDIAKKYLRVAEKTAEYTEQPECELVLTRKNLIFDHKNNKSFLLAHNFSTGDIHVDREASLKELETISKRLCENGLSTIENLSTFPVSISREMDGVSSDTPKKVFEGNVLKIKEYITAGDIFQAVISQRLETPYKSDPFGFYTRLKNINPSPYMYYLDMGERKIAGTSPEMLLRVEDRKALTYPIAGTRKRGKTPEEDLKLEKEMLEDPKERAEHLMLVDLGRNDIGRVSKYGTVKVERFMDVEKYSHVQHIVSEVSGELKPEMDEFDAFASVFPAGTVSGAPKTRAMEIIEELELNRRNSYAGAVGYFGFEGNMDTAIAIRTVVFEKDKAYIQVGAGIVHDSIPEQEFQETLNKARAMLNVIRVSEGE